MAKQTLAELAEAASEAFSALTSALVDAVESGVVEVAVPTKKKAGSYDQETLESMSIKELRELGARHNVGSNKKADIIAALVSAAAETAEEIDDEDDVEDDEDFDDVEEADDDEESDEEEGYTREELEELSLVDLRAILKEADYTAAELKGLDQDALIDLILDEGDEDEEEEADDEDAEDESDDEEDESDDDEEADDEDGEEEEITEESMQKMTLAELKELASDIGVKLPAKGNSKSSVIEAILDSAE